MWSGGWRGRRLSYTVNSVSPHPSTVRGSSVSSGSAYSSGVKPFLSLRSAPAQKQLSTALAMTNALVGPASAAPAISLPFVSYCACRASTWSRRESSNPREMAFRAAGRFSSRMRMCPLFRAGRLVTAINGCWAASAEYSLEQAVGCPVGCLKTALGRTVLGSNRTDISATLEKRETEDASERLVLE